MFETDFEHMLSNYAETISDKSRFTGLVKDFFPAQPMQANLILAAYELGIAKDIQTVSRIDNAFAYRYVKQLVDERGISRLNADWTVAVWCVCYGQHVLGKYCEIKLPSKKSSAAYRPAIQVDKPGVQTYGDLFKYSSSDVGNELAVSGFTGSKNKTIIFQNYYRGKPVTSIMNGAFSESEVEGVILTEGYRSIGYKAFYGCTKLIQVILPQSLRAIENYVFAGCCSLSQCILPQLLERIGQYSLSGTAIKSINLPDSLYFIGEGAFSNCNSLVMAEIPGNITELSDKIFAGCTGLNSVTLREHLERIGAHAFDGCSELGEIVIPQRVCSIGASAFDHTRYNFVIKCCYGSYAEHYALENHIRYQLI